jgi:hypothetical protein
MSTNLARGQLSVSDLKQAEKYSREWFATSSFKVHVLQTNSKIIQPSAISRPFLYGKSRLLFSS